MSDDFQKTTVSKKSKALSARLLAVQAVYQMKHSGEGVRSIYNEYIQFRTKPEVDGEKLVEPDGALFKMVIFGVEERYTELDSVVSANLKRDASDRSVEPLLEAILLCGAYELMVQDDIDAPIIINDYLNVGHSFYEKNEVALINGVLDSIAKAFR